MEATYLQSTHFGSNDQNQPHSMKPIASSLVYLGLASFSFAQTFVTLDGASGSESYNIGRSTTGGLSLGLGFEVEYLVLAGGGGGGGSGLDTSAWGSGGGGAGGLLQGTKTVTNQEISVSVGGGGTAGPRVSTTSQQQGSNGANSSFGDIEAVGGGGGGAYKLQGNTGGSGGGGGGRGTGNNLRTPGGTATFDQGNAGGASRDDDSSGRSAGGGGGGAGSVGGTGGTDVTIAGNGGAGLVSSISGSSVTYGGGGGGGAWDSNVSGETAGTGGAGGGGAGSVSGNASSGINGLGGGGGGVGSAGTGGSGGSGIVIVRYKGDSAAGTGGAISTGTGSALGYTLHTFTTTGSSALDLSGLNLDTRLGAIENGVISGSGDLEFTGPGKLTLNAANTYSGITRINAGTLALGGSGSIASSAGVSIANNATFNVSTVTGGFVLGNTQTISGGGTINGNISISGTHSPGFSPGLQTFADNLSYTTGSNIEWELANNTLEGRGTSFDAIDVEGDLTFSGTTTLSLDFATLNGSINWNNSLWDSNITGNNGWKIFDVSGDIFGFENLQLSSTNWLDDNGLTFSSARPDASFSLYESTDGIYLNYSAIPEPTAALLGGLGLLTLLRRRRA